MKKFFELTVVLTGILALTYGCGQQSTGPSPANKGTTQQNANAGDAPKETEFINLKVTGMT